MKTISFAMATLCGAMALACNSAMTAGDVGGATGAPMGGSGGGMVPVGAGGDAQGRTTGATFFWGTIDVTAPGFVGPPRDEITVGLGPDNSVRYLAWKTLPMLAKRYGDGANDFPLAGSRRISLPSDIGTDYTATVLASAATANHFLLREHVVSSDGLCDYVESVEGTPSGNGWSVVYSQVGESHGPAIDAHGQGVILANDPQAASPVAGQPSLWSAPVELSAPGFSGPPVDHLTLALDGSGQIQWFSFNRFVRQLNYVSPADGLPGAVTLANEGRVTFDDVAPPTATHFALRYEVYSAEKLNDYTEGIEGTRQGDTLTLRYFLSGKLWSAPIEAHATGTLAPASTSPMGGAGGAGG